MSHFVLWFLILLLYNDVHCHGGVLKLLHVQSTGYDSKLSKLVVMEAINKSNDFSISHFEDHTCNSTIVLHWLQTEIDLLQNSSDVSTAVLDGSCPVVSSIIQTRLEHLIVMSYTPYSGRGGQTNHFSLYPVLSDTSQYLIGLLNAFNWYRLAIMTDGGFLRQVDMIAKELMSSGVSVSVQYNHRNESCGNFTTDVCPILLVLGKNELVRTLCNAAGSRRGYPNYLYIIPYWYDVNWWEDAYCGKDIFLALNLSLSLSLKPLGQQVVTHPFHLPDAVLSLYASDAISAVIRSFNESNGNNSNLLRSLEETDMLGRTGLVTFTNRTRPLSSIDIHQYRTNHNYNVNLIKVGNISDDFVLSFENTTTVLPAAEIVRPLHIWVTIVFYTLAVLGLVITGVCCMFNVVYRKKRVVKLSSPHLNYIILIGAVIFYITIFFEASPRLINTNPVIITIFPCNGSSLGAIACAICLCTIQGKMFRIFYIFYKPSPSKKRIKDWHIAVYVAIMTTISSSAVILQWTTPLFRRVALLLPTSEFETRTNELGIELQSVAYICGETNLIAGTIRAILISASLYIMQILSLFLTCFTRKVSVKALNDAISIKAITIISTVSLTALLLFLGTLSSYPTVLISLSSLAYFTVPTTILLLTFVPKMVSLYKDPEGKNVFTYYTGQSVRLTRNNDPPATTAPPSNGSSPPHAAVNKALWNCRSSHN